MDVTRSALARRSGSGQPSPEDRGSRLVGQVDEPRPGAIVPCAPLVVRGWHAWDSRPALAVAVQAGERRPVVVSVGNEIRRDVAEATEIDELAGAGWKLKVPLDGLTPGEVELDVAIWVSESEQPIVVDPIAIVVSGGRVNRRRSEHVLHPVTRFFGMIDLPIDGARIESRALRVVGWALTEPEPADRVEVIVNGASSGLARLGLERNDVHNHYPVPHAVISGYEHLVDLTKLAPDVTEIEVEIRSETASTGPIVLSTRTCPVVRPSTAKVRRSRRAARAADEPVGRLYRPEPPPPSAGDELRLVVFTHDLGYGGAQLWLHELLRVSGAGNRYSCTVVSERGGPLGDQLADMGVTTHVTQPYPHGDIEAYDGRLFEMGRWLEQGRHNAVLVNTFGSFFGADFGVQSGLPTVWGVHESWAPRLFFEAAYPPGTATSDIVKRVESTLGQVDAVVFEAEATRRLYTEFTGEDRAIVVPYGVDVEAIRRFRAQTDRTAVRRAQGFSDSDRVLLVMGTTEPRKAQSLIAEALAEVADEFPSARLVFVGDNGSAYARGLARFVTEAGLSDRVQIHRVTDEIDRWYLAADVLVCASDVESLPRSVIEAMCFGTPVLASAVFGLPEIIEDGVTGLLFEPCQLSSMAEALRRVLGLSDRELQAIADSAQEMAEERFDSHHYASRIIEILREPRPAAPPDTATVV